MINYQHLKMTHNKVCVSQFGMCSEKLTHPSSKSTTGFITISLNITLPLRICHLATQINEEGLDWSRTHQLLLLCSSF